MPFKQGAIAHSVENLIADSGVCSAHTFEKIYHEIISTVILLLGLGIKDGLLSVTSKSSCTEYWLAS